MEISFIELFLLDCIRMQIEAANTVTLQLQTGETICELMNLSMREHTIL